MRNKGNLILVAAMLAAYEALVIGWLWIGNPPEWFRVYFYNIAWWPLLALVETAAQILWNESLLWRRPWSFALLCLASSPFWTFYEIINAVIKNWIYVNLPINPWVRWSNYALAYASVLPAIRVYLDLLHPRFVKTPFKFGRRDAAGALALGAAQLALCLAWPALFYPFPAN